MKCFYFPNKVQIISNSFANSHFSAQSDGVEIAFVSSCWKHCETPKTLPQFQFFPKDHFESSSQPIQWYSSSEGGTGENRSDVTPLNFWIVLIYLAKNLQFQNFLLNKSSPKKISFRPHCTVLDSTVQISFSKSGLCIFKFAGLSNSNI